MASKVKIADVATKPRKLPEHFVSPEGFIRIRLAIQVRDPETNAFVGWPSGAPSISFNTKTPAAVDKVLQRVEETLKKMMGK